MLEDRLDQLSIYIIIYNKIKFKRLLVHRNEYSSQ